MCSQRERCRARVPGVFYDDGDDDDDDGNYDDDGNFDDESGDAGDG